MVNTWSDVGGKVFVEFGWQDGQLVDVIDDETPIPEILRPFVPDCNENAGTVLVIEYLSSGYYDAGSMYGGWQNLGSPPEGDEERVLDDIYIEYTTPAGEDADGKTKWDNKIISLPKEVQEELFGQYFNLVEEDELEPDDYCPEPPETW